MGESLRQLEISRSSVTVAEIWLVELKYHNPQPSSVGLTATVTVSVEVL